MFQLAALRDARSGACGSSNQRAGAHHRAQPARCGDVCQDCVYLAWIIGNPAGNRVTAALDSCLLLYCAVPPIVL